MQYVDCDETSTWNHSRNFVSGWMNFLVFDNGFHTVHHQRASLHWSHARAAHAEVAHEIDPRLEENDIASYCWKAYVLRRPGPRWSSGPRRAAPPQGTSLGARLA